MFEIVKADLPQQFSSGWAMLLFQGYQTSCPSSQWMYYETLENTGDLLM